MNESCVRFEVNNLQRISWPGPQWKNFFHSWKESLENGITKEGTGTENVISRLIREASRWDLSPFRNELQQPFLRDLLFYLDVLLAPSLRRFSLRWLSLLVSEVYGGINDGENQQVLAFEKFCCLIGFHSRSDKISSVRLIIDTNFQRTQKSNFDISLEFQLISVEALRSPQIN